MSQPQESLTRALSCFLSATSSVDTAVIQRVLADLDVRVQTTADIPAGSQFASMIMQTVLSADFVCIVLTGEPTSPAVTYEAGIAAGSRRPLLIITTPDAADPTLTDIMQGPIIRYQPGAEQVLRDNLLAYLRQVRPIAAELTVNWDILTREADRLVERGGYGQAPGRVLEQRVVARLAHAGALVRSNVHIGDLEADAIATFPTLGDAFNPVIVEVKARLYKRDTMQLFGFLQALRARLGILVHSRQTPAYNMLQGGTALLVVSVAELEGWSDEEIVRRLTGLRNELVHGAR